MRSKRSWWDEWDGPAAQKPGWYLLVLMLFGLPLFAVFLEVVGWVFNGRWVIGWDQLTLSVALTLAAITVLYVVLWALDAVGRLTFALVKGAWTRRAQSRSTVRRLRQALKRVQEERGGVSMSGVSWRDAGHTDEEGRQVRNWVARNLDAADGEAARVLDAHPDGLGETPVDPGTYLNLDDRAWVRADVQRKRWGALLDAIDQDGAPGFMKAHAEWVKAGTP